MKNLHLIALAIVALTVGACCNTTPCLDSTDITEVSYVGFADADLANPYIVRYQTFTDFNAVIDTIWLNTNTVVKSGDRHTYTLPSAFNVTVEYRFHAANNAQYSVGNLVMKLIKCDGCFAEGTRVIDSYDVNGTTRKSQEIEVHKTD